jgi:hypothetical protein
VEGTTGLTSLAFALGGMITVFKTNDSISSETRPKRVFVAANITDEPGVIAPNAPVAALTRVRR